MILRKITKNRGLFPSDEALSKLFYLALRNISQKWNMPILDSKAALNRLSIEFEDRVPQQGPLTPFTKKSDTLLHGTTHLPGTTTDDLKS
jgi:hypothetical protein